ncbi:MAG: hypothetical protein Q8S73_21300 [Deltaproteobacteria bacterium]|nr:hypothetical protein [Myxococcales bacterium]MDP3216661.1 hypothetical protein [Deltaproteobacteria bacterium]
MHARCPRCLLDFDAASAWVQCPRCGSPVTAAPPPTHPQPQYVPATQAVDPAMLAQVMRASSPNPNPPPPAGPPSTYAPAPGSPAYQPAYAPPGPPAYPPAYAAPATPPGFVAEEDLPGRAVISVVLSIVALLGGCNPVGLVGVVVGLMAYAAANDRRVDLARARGRTARRIAYASLAITAVVWVVVVLSLFYEIA